MKKILFILITLLTLQASAQETSKQYDRIGKFYRGVALVWKNGLVGMIKQNGNEIVKPEYEKIGSFGNDALALTTKGGKIGLINIEGKVIAANIYDYIGAFHGAYALTKKDGLSGMINKQGKVVVENKYEKLKVGRYGDVRAIVNGQEVLLDIKN